jgi:hypothetical protein
MKARQPCAPADFSAKPKLLKDVIEACFVFGRINRDLGKSPVREFDAPIRKAADRWIVSDHQNRMPSA